VSRLGFREIVRTLLDVITNHPGVHPALVRPHPSVASSAAGAADWTCDTAIPAFSVGFGVEELTGGWRCGLAVRVACRQAGSPPSKTGRTAILRKWSLAWSASLAIMRPSGNFGADGKMILIRPADMADAGTMNAHQRNAVKLIRPIPTGRPVGSAVRSDHSRDFRQPEPPIPDGFLTNECRSVRIPATPAKTTDA
jgi:hypothetical protein